MLKSRLYWKVLANFGLLLLILTAMTILTLNLLSQIEKNFTVASSDMRALNTLEQVRSTLNDIPTAAYRYALVGSQDGKENYFQQWRDLASQLALLDVQFADSASRSELMTVREYCTQWKQQIGDRLVAFGDERTVKGQAKDLEARLQEVVSIDAKVRTLSSARVVLGDMYEKRMPSQIRNLDVATNLSGRLSDFVSIINVLLAVFSIALGFVLTRSITHPVRLLKEGTQNIMAGKYEPINLQRTDELGELAADFNKMSTMLGNNYNRLNAYSELVTTLNS